MDKRFDVRFHPDAWKEYKGLDNSIIELVDKVIDKLEYRAETTLKNLSNLNESKLAGCKELKLRDAGIRIVFRVTSEIVEFLRVVYIYTIERRNDGLVFKIADKRNKDLKTLNKVELKKRSNESEK